MNFASLGASVTNTCTFLKMLSKLKYIWAITTQLAVLLCALVYRQRPPVPANLSSGEDESVAQVVISVEFSVVECLFETGNQELG